ncbi:MAG: hypothetical protein H0V01_05150 [Bacteroidetes bacterium]|nr:hypothetical protein [Bacteroidota bacterium]HET6244804.1 hypothetical protein [Bacteroidia bacterium]
MYQLNMQRLGLFIRRQSIMNIKSFWIALGAISGFLTILTILIAYVNPYALENLKALYIVVFYFSGLIFTSKIFSELDKPQKSYSLLTLPVSNMEKMAGAWLITSPGFTMIYLLFIFLIISLSSLISGAEISLRYFFDLDTWRSVGVYLVIQTFFMLGACTFKGNNFLKTILSILLFCVLISIFSALTVSLIFKGGQVDSRTMDIGFTTYITDTFVPVISFLFWYLLGPFMLLVSFFKLKERQV